MSQGSQTCQPSIPVVKIDGFTVTERDLLVAAIAATGVLVIYALLKVLMR